MKAEAREDAREKEVKGEKRGKGRELSSHGVMKRHLLKGRREERIDSCVPCRGQSSVRLREGGKKIYLRFCEPIDQPHRQVCL